MNEIEEEAEAAILALGRRLDWEGEEGFFFDTRRKQYPRSDWYEIYYQLCGEYNRHQWHVAYRQPRQKSIDAPFVWDEIVEAKAACERHHATGKWD